MALTVLVTCSLKLKRDKNGRLRRKTGKINSIFMASSPPRYMSATLCSESHAVLPNDYG
jgi:hypothetical protein